MYTITLQLLFLLFSFFLDSIQAGSGQQSVATLERVKQDSSQFFYRSDDYGSTWEKVGNGLPSNTRVSLANKIGDAIVIATDNMGLLMLKENRTNWIQIGHDLPNRKINALYVSGGNIFVGVYKQGIYTSNDLGHSWKPLNYDLPDLRVQAITEINGDLLAGTDSGIFRLSDASNKWSNLFYGFQINSFSHYRGELIAGTNLGAITSNDQGINWDWIQKKGTVVNTAIVNNRMVLMHISGDLYVSNYWGSFDKIEYSAEKSAVYEFVQVERYWVISNNDGIRRSIDQGKTWERVYETNNESFFDFFVIGSSIYGGTTAWNRVSTATRGC